MKSSVVSFFRFVISILLFGSVCLGSDEEAGCPLPTLLAKRGELILDDQGKLGEEFADGVRCRRGKTKWKWMEDSGAWRSLWVPDMGHTPVVSYVGFREDNLIVEVTFRYGKMTKDWQHQCFRVAMDDRPKITGHILSAWANRNNDFIDEGFLLQHITKTKKKEILSNLHLDKRPLEVEPEKWYTAVVECVGDEALFRMGDHVAYAQNKELRASKNLVSLTTGKTWHEVKRIRIWKASLNPEWPDLKESVLKKRKELPSD